MASFTGSITTTGTSQAIRLEKTLFDQHKEFRQKAKVRAHVIAPGQLLISIADVNESTVDETEDPIFEAFLAFIEADMTQNPARVTALSAENIETLLHLTKDVVVSDNEPMPDDVDW